MPICILPVTCVSSVKGISPWPYILLLRDGEQYTLLHYHDLLYDTKQFEVVSTGNV
jgi:hypothetical protein